MKSLQKLVFAAVVAASPLAMAASASAATPHEDSLQAFWESLSAGSWWTQTGNTFTGNYSAGSSAVVSGPLLAITSTLYSWSLQIFTIGSTTYAKGSETYGTQSINFVFNGSSYVDDGTAFGPKSTSYSVDTSYTVPGPVAAAGLPALIGFAGWAAWRRRRSVAA